MKRTLIAALFAVLLASCMVSPDIDKWYMVEVIQRDRPGIEFMWVDSGEYGDYYTFDDQEHFRLLTFLVRDGIVTEEVHEGYR